MKQETRVELQQEPDSPLIHIVHILTIPHPLQFLIGVFPRLTGNFPPKEVRSEKIFITLSLDNIDADRIGQLDTMFYESPLSRFTQVIDASSQPWKLADTRFGKFVVCNDSFYIFSESYYTHWQAYKELCSTLGISSRAQCAGMIYIACEQHNRQIIRRSISGVSTTLADTGELSIKESQQFKENILVPRLEQYFEIS